MIFISLLLALALEQIRPVRPHHPVQRNLARWMNWVEHLFFAGRPAHAYLVWFLSVALPALLVFFVYSILSWFTNDIVSLIFSVAILYISLGFRQFSAPYTIIKSAIEKGDIGQSRAILAKWLGTPENDWTQEQILQKVLDKGVWGLHIHVLGVISTYALSATLGFGPSGALAYRLAEMFIRRRSKLPGSPSDDIEHFSQRAWDVINWIPTRITVLLFSIVGNFEEVIEAWRRQISPPRKDHELLSNAASAAIHIRYQIRNSDANTLKHENNLNDTSDTTLRHYSSGSIIAPHHLQSLIGLAWRSVIIALALILLIQVGQLIALVKLLIG